MQAKKTLLTTLAIVALSTAPALHAIAAPAKAAHSVKAGKTAANAVAPIGDTMRDAGKPVEFAQAYSDLKADPAVVFGRLPNGMTYAILRNATPPGNVSLRLRVNGGSMMESEQQRGLAHFIEHMAFNGSKNVPEGDMVKILERHGLKFGPDTNAFTAFDQTVYQLDLPKNGADDIDTGLFLLRETAGNLTLDDGAIDRERGVILGEERLRDTPSTHDFKAWSNEIFPGQRYSDRLPIGLVPVIQNSKHDTFADLYANFYRPELETLIVVGDVDPKAIEATIKAKFGDLKAPATPIRATNFGTYTTKGPLFDTYTETGLPDAISMSWMQPVDERYQTKAKNVADFLDEVRISILNERFERMAKAEDSPFASAQASHEHVEHTAELTQLNITPKPGKDKAALAAAYTAVRQYEQFGADQGEIDRQIAALESGFRQQAASAKTRETRSLADSIADSLESGEVYTSPAEDLQFFEELKPHLTAQNLNSGITKLFGGDGPFLWHSGETVGDLDKAALKSTYDMVSQAKLTAQAANVTKPWPYTEFGTPSAIVKREEVKDLGLTQLTYANGLKVTIKSTKFKEDEIGVSVRFDGGVRSIDPASKAPVFVAGVSGVSEGGLGKLSAPDLKDTLAGKIVSINFGIGEDATTLAGGTNAKDFPTQMQLLMAFTTDAAYRQDAFDQLKAFIPNYYTSLAASPGGVFQMKAGGVLHSGDPRFGMPTQAEFLATGNDETKALIEKQLKTAPVEITIVGDITEAQAEAEIAKTFATLKPRAPVTIPADADNIHFPTTDLTQVFEHNGRADQDLSFIAWPGADFYSSTKRARGLSMLSEVIGLRLIDVVREKQAIAYSPNAGNTNSQSFTNYGFLTASAEVKPENDQAFYDDVVGIVADLKAHPITDDELARAQKPLIDRMDFELKTNTYWEQVLPGSMTDPRKLDAVRTRRDQYLKVTAADIQALANQYLDMSKALRIQVKPSAKASAAAPAPAPAAAAPAGK
jgi:zinc protease